MSPTRASIESRLNEIQTLFSFSPERANSFIKQFHDEMSRGLEQKPSSLKMIDSFARRPTGKEIGTFLALDLGGTNFRVMAVKLGGNGSVHVTSTSRYSIPKELITGKGEMLFDFIASSLSSFIKANKLPTDKTYALGFTFSFPVRQTGIKSGTLIAWTKGFCASNVIDHDVVKLLEDAMQRHNIDCIKVEALANDTVGTMMAKCYAKPTCDVGVILGTGTNACYPEKKLNGLTVNTEWGNFNKLELTPFDKKLDDASNNRGAQLFEKAVSGMYLGEIFRLIAQDLIATELLFPSMKDKATAFFSKPYSFSSEQMSAVADDSFDIAAAGLKGAADDDLAALKSIAKFVSTRSARLAASAVAALVIWQDAKLNERHIIAIDGSLYEKYPRYREEMLTLLNDIFGGHSRNIEFELAKDGSGTGAAVIAAVASTEHNAQRS